MSKCTTCIHRDVCSSSLYYLNPNSCDEFHDRRDYREVKKGTWLRTHYNTENKVPIYECSECGKQVADRNIESHNYCLSCGAYNSKVKSSYKGLRCCPICKSKSSEGHIKVYKDDNGFWIVHCLECGCNTGNVVKLTKQEAIYKWNTRSDNL